MYEVGYKEDDPFLAEYLPVEYREDVLWSILGEIGRNLPEMSDRYPFGIFAIDTYDFYDGFVMELQESLLETVNTIICLDYGKDYEELTGEEKEIINEEYCTYVYHYDAIYIRILKEVMTAYHYFFSVFNANPSEEELQKEYAHYAFINSPLQEVW